jgi:sporulation protein YlmC with PRC-barrel domain
MQTGKLALLSTMLIGLGGAAFAQQISPGTGPDATDTQPPAAQTTQQQPGTEPGTQQPGTQPEIAEDHGVEGQPGAIRAEDDPQELRADDAITADTRAASRSVTTAGEPYTGTVFGTMQADDIIGMSVVDAEGSNVGSVTDLLIGADSGVERAVIDVGGFLGFGAKSVAVDIGELTVNQEEEEIVLNLTRDQLDEMPEWSEDHEQGLTD